MRVLAVEARLAPHLNLLLPHFSRVSTCLGKGWIELQTSSVVGLGWIAADG